MDQPNSYRRPLAVGLLLAGVVLLGIAFLLWVRTGEPSAGPPAERSTNPASTIVEARQLLGLLLLLLVLFLVFTVATLALVRWSRRFRAAITHRPHPPTPSDDVWRMHRLPQEPSDSAKGNQPP